MEGDSTLTPASPSQVIDTNNFNRSLAKRPRMGEMIIEALLFVAGVISILTTIGIIYVLASQALLFFSSPEVSIVEFFSGTEWIPAIGKFGVWSLVNATLMVSGIAMLVALPLGLATAIYLSEYASLRARSSLKPHLRGFGRDSDRGLRVLCPDLHDPTTKKALWR